jgi:F-type H+-transporting ATPase subunit c
MARQPEMANDLRNASIIIAALLEGVALFALLICFLI